MKNSVGIILLIAALVLGYLGYDKMQNSKAGIKIGELEISATDKSSSDNAFIFYGLGALCLLGGIVIMAKGGSK